MEQYYSLLIIGLLSDHHIQRLILHLRAANPYSRIDFMATSLPSDLPEEVKNCITNLYVACDRNVSSTYKKLISSLKMLKRISHNKYDVINIHFPCYYHCFYLPYLRKMTTTLLLSPWGSDVYRVNKIERVLLKILYKKE